MSDRRNKTPGLGCPAAGRLIATRAAARPTSVRRQQFHGQRRANPSVRPSVRRPSVVVRPSVRRPSVVRRDPSDPIASHRTSTSRLSCRLSRDSELTAADVSAGLRTGRTTGSDGGGGGGGRDGRGASSAYTAVRPSALGPQLPPPTPGEARQVR